MSDSGKTKEYVRLWTTHGQRVYAYILSLVANRADAEELFQDVSMTLWTKFDQFAPESDFRAWACRVAFNKVRSFQQLRRHKTLLCSSEFLEIIDRVVVDRSETLDAQYRALANCLEKLHPRDRDLIDRRYRVGATPKTVAESKSAGAWRPSTKPSAGSMMLFLTVFGRQRPRRVAHERSLVP